MCHRIRRRNGEGAKDLWPTTALLDHRRGMGSHGSRGRLESRLAMEESRGDGGDDNATDITDMQVMLCYSLCRSHWGARSAVVPWHVIVAPLIIATYLSTSTVGRYKYK